MKNIETKRLLLRKFTYSDLDGMYHNWCSDESVTPYVTWNVHKNIEETRKLLDSWIKDYDNGSLKWVVELKEIHEIIGSIDVVKDDKKNKLAEIGYAYGSKYWNKCYATEALKAVIDYLLIDYEILVARHIKENIASGKVMQKANMKYDGFLRSRIINSKTGNREDLCVYSIIRGENL